MEDAAAAAVAEDGGPGSLHVRARHIKKRALKNKALAVSFNEKDLKDYVAGFHKRKKKRRKEALQQQAEAERRKRIELRKKRKMEREFAQFGETAADSGSDGAGSDEEDEHDEGDEPVASVSGMMTYDNGDMQVIVKTSEISREEDNAVDRSEVVRTRSDEASEKSKKQSTPLIRKKLTNRAPKKRRSRTKPQSKREKRQGKIKNSRLN